MHRYFRGERARDTELDTGAGCCDEQKVMGDQGGQDDEKGRQERCGIGRRG